MAYIPICKFDIASVGFDISAFDSGFLTETEFLSTTDVVTKSAIRFFMESAACKFDTAGQEFDESVFDIGSPHITDSIHTAGAESVVELIVVDDIIYHSGKKLLNESISVIDTLIILAILKFDEILSITDSVIRRILMIIRKISIKGRGGSYESDIELGN